MVYGWIAGWYLLSAMLYSCAFSFTHTRISDKLLQNGLFLVLWASLWMATRAKVPWLSVSEPDLKYPVVSPPMRWMRLSFIAILSAAILINITHREQTMAVDLYEHGPRLSSVNSFIAGKIPCRDFFVHYGLFQEVLRPWVAFQIWGFHYQADLQMGAWLVGLASASLFILLSDAVSQFSLILVLGYVMLFQRHPILTDRSLWYFCQSSFTAGALRTRECLRTGAVAVSGCFRGCLPLVPAFTVRRSASRQCSVRWFIF